METMMRIFSVAVGGALGSVARYLVGISPLARIFDNFPLPTFLINITGSFLIGFSVILFQNKFETSENLRLGLLAGFLGAFTTFSTFEIEAYGLAQNRHLLISILYVVLSVAVGYLGVACGVVLGRRI
jgi:CrcB protein